MITTLGKAHIRAYMAGLAPSIGQSISIGIREVAPTVSDVSMGFEVQRVPVSSVSLDPLTNKIVFKGEVSTPADLSVREIGLWSSISEDAVTVLTFDENEESWTGSFTHTSPSASSRIGGSVMNMSVSTAAAVSAEYSIFPMDLSSLLGPEDTWTLALNKTGAASLKVTLELSSSTGTKTLTFFPSGTSSNGYMFSTVAAGSATTSGDFDPSGIEKFKVTVVPASGNTTESTVMLDGISAVNSPADREGSILVARALVTPAFTTLSTSPTDVEYELEVNV